MKIMPLIAAVAGLLLSACAATPEAGNRAPTDINELQFANELNPVSGPAPGAVASQPVLKAQPSID